MRLAPIRAHAAVLAAFAPAALAAVFHAQHGPQMCLLLGAQAVEQSLEVWEDGIERGDTRLVDGEAGLQAGDQIGAALGAVGAGGLALGGEAGLGGQRLFTEGVEELLLVGGQVETLGAAVENALQYFRAFVGAGESNEAVAAAALHAAHPAALTRKPMHGFGGRVGRRGGGWGSGGNGGGGRAGGGGPRRGGG